VVFKSAPLVRDYHTLQPLYSRAINVVVAMVVSNTAKTSTPWLKAIKFKKVLK